MGFWKANSSSGSKEPAVEPAPPPPSDAAAASPLPTPSTTTRTTPATHAPIEIAPARSLFPRSEYSRLSTSFEARTIFAGTVALLSGVTLGMLHGSGAAALRYRAENAHRLPTDATGWYLYHKSKNYHAMRGGVREGARMGVKLCVWVSGFFMCEEAIDRARGFGENTRGDFGSTVVAGLGTAGAWSLWNRFPPVTIARTARMGLVVGLGYGLLQDAVTLLKGQRLGYIDCFRHIPRRMEERRQRNMERALARRGDGGDSAQHT